MGLIRPRTVFIDTNHLIRLRDLRSGRIAALKLSDATVAGYRWLLGSLSSGLLVPTTSIEQAFDWVGNQSLASGNGIAKVFDVAPRVQCVGQSPFLFLQELLLAASRVDTSIVVHDAQPLHWLGESDWSPRFMVRYLPEWRKNFPGGYDGRPRLFKTVLAMLQSARQVVEAEGNIGQDVLADFREDFNSMKLQKPGTKGFHDFSRRDYAIRRLRVDQAVAMCHPKLPVESVINQLDLNACPAFDLWNRVVWEYFRAKAAPRRSDRQDLLHVPYFPYVDYVLTERGLRGLLVNANYAKIDRIMSDVEQLQRSIGRADAIALHS